MTRRSDLPLDTTHAVPDLSIRVKVAVSVAVLLGATLLGLQDAPEYTGRYATLAFLFALGGPFVVPIQAAIVGADLFDGATLFVIGFMVCVAPFVWHARRRTVGSFFVAATVWALTGLLFGIGLTV